MPSESNPFRFCEVYSAPTSAKNKGNIHRMWRGVNLLADRIYEVSAFFPFSVKPAKKLTVFDLFSVLRDYYENTSFDLTEGYQAKSPHYTDESTICADDTQYGFVAQLRSWMPVEIGAVLWLAPRRPCTQAAIPWYCGVTEIPNGFASASYQDALMNHFNAPADIYQENLSLAYYDFAHFSKKMDDDYGRKIQQVRAKWQEFEAHLLQNQRDFEVNILKIYHQNPAQAGTMLNEFTSEKAKLAREMLKKLMD